MESCGERKSRRTWSKPINTWEWNEKLDYFSRHRLTADHPALHTAEQVALRGSEENHRKGDLGDLYEDGRKPLESMCRLAHQYGRYLLLGDQRRGAGDTDGERERNAGK